MSRRPTGGCGIPATKTLWNAQRTVLAELLGGKERGGEDAEVQAYARGRETISVNSLR
jgi:hypothetical protein